MAKADLEVLVEDIKQKIESQSETYRKLRSDRKVHSITIDQDSIINEVTVELEKRIGVASGKLQKSIKDIIDTEVPKMVAGIRQSVILYGGADSPQNRKASFVESMEGTPTKFTFVLSAKADKSANIFNAFRKIKQVNQRALLNKLRAAITKLNNGRTNKANEIRQIGRNFLDIGHQEGSAVSEQRKKEAQAALFDYTVNKRANQTVVKFLKELQDSITLSITKKDGQPVDIIEAELESKYLNRQRGGGTEKRLAKELNDDLQKIMEAFGASEYANIEGSDSKVEKIRKTILNPFAEKAAKNPKIKANFKSEKIKESRATAKTTLKSGKVSRGERKDLTTIDKTPVFDTKSRRSMFSFIAMINKKLPQTVEKNMRAPRLENQSGRFARSVEIKDVIQTRKGFPSFGYTYDKEPYQVFEVGKGLEPWASPDRDPRRLIDGSIREIAADMALGRFFTRRL